MQVWCIEAENGKGVYGTGLGFKCTRAALDDDARCAAGEPDKVPELWHPAPDEEPALKDFWNGTKLSVRKRIDWVLNGRRDWYCGFEDQAQMLRWFPREGFTKMTKMDLATGHGLQVCVYEIHGQKAKRGEHQVIFKKKEAKLLRKIPIANFSG